MASFDPIEPDESSEFTLDGGELWLYVRDARHKLLGGMTATDIGERLSDGRLAGKEMVSLDRVNWIGIRYLDRLSAVLAGGRAAADAVDAVDTDDTVDMAPPPLGIAPPLGIDEETWDRAAAPPPAAERIPPVQLESREPLDARGAPLVDPDTLDIRPPTRRSWTPAIVLGLLVMAASIGVMLDRRSPELTVQVTSSAVSATDEASEGAPLVASTPAAKPPPSASATPVEAVAEAEAPAEPRAEPGGDGPVDATPAKGSVSAAAAVAEPAEETASAPEAREATRRRPRSGKLRIESDRPLQVRVAGRDRGGMAPTRLTLPAGAHRISLLDPSSGQVVLERRVRVRPGRLATLEAPPAAPARVEKPTLAAVEADVPEDVRAGADAPGAPEDVAARPASLDDEASPSPSGAPAPAEPDAVSAAAEAPDAAPPGYISVTARESLLVVVDGVSTGERTPLWMHAVPSGRRLIELRAADGRVVHRRATQVPSNQTVPVLFQK